MNSANQDKPESNIHYDANVALEFFKQFGEMETAKASKTFFVLGQKPSFFSFLQNHKTYLLVEGTVTIQTAAGHTVHIQAGELFGEFTPYTFNNATASAEVTSRLITLSEKQLLTGLSKKPEFLFMLIDVLLKYLQQADTDKQDALLLTQHENLKHNGVLDSDMLEEVKQTLGDNAIMIVPEKRIVFREGGAALLMYVILEGYMAIIVDNKVVARSGRGDIVGEIGLVAPRHSRTASVVAETRCVLLGIDRATLLQLIQALPSFGITLLRVAISHWYGRHTTAK